jgi:hypothetical protein
MSGSPFPGMDPYLEGEMWQEFHGRLINQISQQLMPLLKPKYVAFLSRRLVIDYSSVDILGDYPEKKVIYPDVYVGKGPELKETTALTYDTSKGFSAPAVELDSPLLEEMPIMSVEVRDTAERRLVTVIEILSPVNKRGSGYRDYLEKRLSLMQTETHLLEIDLLRNGQRIQLAGGELPIASYYVFLSRFTRRPRTEVWPVQLQDKLPTVPVPLLPPDDDVPLNLQQAVDDCFSVVGYEVLLDYTQPPPPPELNDGETAWFDMILASRVSK